MFDDDLVGQTTLPFSVLALDQLTKLQHLPTPAKKKRQHAKPNCTSLLFSRPTREEVPRVRRTAHHPPFLPQRQLPGRSQTRGVIVQRLLTRPDHASQSNASNGSVGASPSLAEPRFDDAAQHYDELPQRLHPFWLPESCLVVCAPLQALVPPQQRSLLRPPIIQHRPRRPSTPEE